MRWLDTNTKNQQRPFWGVEKTRHAFMPRSPSSFFLVGEALFFLVGEVLSTHQTFWLSAEDSQQKWEDLQSTCSRCCPPLVGPELSAQTLRCSCRERCAHLRLSLARGLPRARERLGLCGRGSDGSAWRRESISKEKDFEGQGPHSPSKYH